MPPKIPKNPLTTKTPRQKQKQKAAEPLSDIDTASLPLAAQSALESDVEDEVVSFSKGLDSNLQALAQECIISYNTIDVFNLPATPAFGIYNPRPLRPKAVTQLANTFQSDIFTPFLAQCAFPIVMDKKDIIPASVSRQPAFDGTSPLLQVAPTLKTLNFCGGHHRLEALPKARKTLNKIVESSQRALKKPPAGSEAPSPNIKIDLEIASARLSKLNLWSCIIYDKANSIAELVDQNKRLGVYLSANKQEIKASADPPETSMANFSSSNPSRLISLT
ncbi:hypothetical protein AGABI1DRAFT_95380, partial [Agaricus bisporus var. burnettii JB137-S8]